METIVIRANKTEWAPKIDGFPWAWRVFGSYDNDVWGVCRTRDEAREKAKINKNHLLMLESPGETAKGLHAYRKRYETGKRA